MSLLDGETTVRLGFFLGVLLVMALAEMFVPRRHLTVSRPRRWSANLGLAVLNTLVLRAVLPVGVVGVALVAEQRRWGLLHDDLGLPEWLSVVLAVLALDLAIYFQHVLFHAVPVLWRLHMVHHADPDFDVTTGLRFHTLEMLLSLGIKLAVVVLLGAPALAVLCFEVLLNATSMFNHGNIRIPAGLERALRLVLVTPDMHRVHHSVIVRETNSNFGFNVPWWDFLFGTYRGQPADGHDRMAIGLAQVRDARAMRLLSMVALPFGREMGRYPINRRGTNGPISDSDADDATTQTPARPPVLVSTSRDAS
ncbi:MAG TPA: sterol desaturase family protein [Pirellulales bacterium]|nr:sterol desaturase family protein [Pirellulales bacterium]